MSLTQLDKDLEAEYEAGRTPFHIDAKSIASTGKTANIRVVSDEIEWLNEFQIIVCTAKLDNIEYGAIFDRNTKKGYTVVIERLNDRIVNVRDLDRVNEDEEWATMSDYFSRRNVFDSSRIHQWLWNTRITPALADGIPAHLLRRK